MEYSKEVLRLIDEMPIKELFVKLELLNWQEQNIKEIQGTLTGGSISINGDSSVRRTCTLNFIAVDEEVEDYIKLNTKFRLFIGLKNRLPIKYKELGNILWFKEGVFVFNQASFTHNATNTTVNISAKDKMCLLNGDCGGVIPDTVIWHEIEIEPDEEGNARYEQIKIRQLIVELVNHYGEEDLQNIFVDDVPDQARALMQYNGDRPIYLQYSMYDTAYNGNFTFDAEEAEAANKTSAQTGIKYIQYTSGQAIGYTLTDFTYPGELISNPGETICSILDKIKGVLGNFEYYYDVDGHFCFREIRNYINNSYIPLTQLSTGDYQANFDIEDIVYSFKDNRKLISSYANNPKYGNIKNDYVIWGTRISPSGAEIPVRYHLAIDDKPAQTSSNPSPEWRERLYQYVKDATDEQGLDFYRKEMIAEWRKLYDPDNPKWNGWNPNVDNDPASLDFFIDFIDTNTEYGQYSVSKIGRRTISKVDKDCVSVIANEIPQVIFTLPEDAESARQEGYNPSIASQSLLDLMTISGNRKSCYDAIRELLYQNLTLNESITISCLPIYWLDANSKIEVEDNSSKVYGQYMIKTISLPLTYNGTTSIQANRALTRI